MGAGDGGELFEVLDRAVAAVCGAEVDLLDEAGLTGRLDRLHHAQARIAAERARLVAVIEQRRTETITDHRQQEQARQQLRRDLTRRTNQAPAQTKLDAEAGLAATEHPTTGQAFAAGRISADHVRLIAETLDTLPHTLDLDRIEHDLVELASQVRPTILGRHVRELLARHAPITVTLREEHQQRQRRTSLVDTPDGGLALSGLLHGTAAETVRTAIEAFRRPDLPGELRTPAQRTADALEQLCATALRTGQAPTRHGVRPQILITITTDQLDLGPDGIAHLGSGETTTLGRLRHLLNDSSWGRVILGPDSTPIEASENVRTVPQGLWRALIARDRGCTWPGCDAPPAWCDVAHGTNPFTTGGQLSPNNATLLCRRHHRRFDHGNYHITINGNQVHYHRQEDINHPPEPDQPPEPQPAGPNARQPDRAVRTEANTDIPRAPGETTSAPTGRRATSDRPRSSRRGTATQPDLLGSGDP
jgi:hypothetical protein